MYMVDPGLSMMYEPSARLLNTKLLLEATSLIAIVAACRDSNASCDGSFVKRDRRQSVRRLASSGCLKHISSIILI